jgi:RNA polymerase sigma-70 factor (ECF subfamily)
VTDFELLAAWRAGDREAGQELARNHYKAVRQFVSGKVDDETAKEIAQQTFLTLCQRKDEFEGFSQFRTFLLGIARFKVIEHYRRQRMYGEHFDPLEHSVVDPNLERTLSTVFAAHEHERIVVQALRSLPLDDQFLLELKAHAGLKNRELAEVFRVTIGSIAGRINRARERLAKAIATLSDDPELKADGSLESWVSSVCAKLPNELREP